MVPTASSQQQQICAHCSKIATPTYKRCADAPDSGGKNQLMTYYCDASCQKSHWSLHKSACKKLSTRKQLYRAGAILQQIFYNFRGTAFDKCMTKSREREIPLFCTKVNTNGAFWYHFPRGCLKTKMKGKQSFHI